MIDVTLAVSARSKSIGHQTMSTLCTQRRRYVDSRHRLCATNSQPTCGWNRYTRSTLCENLPQCTPFGRRATSEPSTRVGRSNWSAHVLSADHRHHFGPFEPSVPLKPCTQCKNLKQCTQCELLGLCTRCGLRTRLKPSRTCAQFHPHRSRQWRRRQRCSQQ